VDLLEEGEQWEAVKAWVRVNGLAVFGGALLGVLGLLGWRWWQSHAEAQHLAANVAYEKLVADVQAASPEDALKGLDQFHRDFGDSAYGPPAELAAARLLVARNELDKAAQRLRVVADTAKDVQLRMVAKVRLARVQIAQGKPDDAIATLGVGDAGAFKSLVAEVRGDALQAKGDKAGALREFQAARDARGPGAEPPGSDGADLLELKIDDLRGEVATAPPAAPKG